jgi:hypothetical protein
MRLYLAGPMTGYTLDNAPAFAAAAAELRAAGHDVVTPVELNAEVWARHHPDEPYDPAVHKVGYGDPMLDEMFAEDLKAVAMREGVALLPGWEKSRGALAEVHVGTVLGKRFLDARGFEVLIDFRASGTRRYGVQEMLLG